MPRYRPLTAAGAADQHAAAERNRHMVERQVTESTVLLIGHSASRESGRVTPLLKAKGYRTEWRCPFEGDALPDDSRTYAAAIVFGGLQSANDAESCAYIRQEIDWIGRFVDAGGRYLGICLGGQLLARAQIGRAHVCTPATNAHLVCRLLLEKKKHT